MKEKDILTQLNSLKNIQPDEQWKKSNRDVLLHQIFGQQADSAGIEFKWSSIRLPLQVMRSLSQPVMAVVLILAFMLGGSIFSLQAAKNTKPGDSLYIAKIISEKTQFVFTFGEKGKARLGIEFAGNRAKEITQVLADADSNKEERVEKLVSDFKKEISEAKTRLEKISSDRVAIISKQSESVADEQVKKEESSLAKIVEDKNNEDENNMVFSANLGKDEKGIQVSDPGQDEPVEIVEPADSGQEDVVVVNQDAAVDTTTMDIISIASSSVSEIGTSNPEEILKEAEELLDNEDYNATLNKLEEADQAISQTDKGEVKGEYASSTESNIENGEVLGVEEEAASSTEE